MDVDRTYSDVDVILVIDFGSQYTHLIIRRLHELGVHCDLRPHTTTLKELYYRPKGIILSGGPCSVYEKDAPHASDDILNSKIPILGVCYGMQELAHVTGGTVKFGNREYGGSIVLLSEKHRSALYRGLPENFETWTSHGDSVYDIPEKFVVTAYSSEKTIASFENEKEKIYAVQYHPEVNNTSYGKYVIKNFVDICEVVGKWSMPSFLEYQINQIRTIVDDSHVICAVSGGVDSTVAASLMKKAIGNRFHAVLVDTGLLRLDEAKIAKKYLKDELGVNIEVINASDIFLPKLVGVTDPEQKRKIIGGLFINVFEDYLKDIKSRIESSGEKAEYLMQGTLYSDVIESNPLRPGSQTIKSHHNVGGLLKNMKFKLVEPLRELFKDEVRQLGELIGLNKEILIRHPFPGPGLAIRIVGEVTPERVQALRMADDIFISELKKANIYNEISQAFCVLLAIKSVGVMGDARTYEETICVRAISTDDFMTSSCYFLDSNILKNVSSKITAQVKGINRVVFDVSSKPPATIEWE